MILLVPPLPPYSLDQLADASGEKARTIRSWIKERVLPPARGGGRGAFYGQEHMDRLLFIKRLREQTGTRLPLAMIRSVLERLYASDDPDVVRRVAHGEEPLQVAGLIARRIICRLEEGQAVERGARYGLIRFGSRVDIYLPPEAEAAVTVGDRVKGGESVIAKWKSPREPGPTA